MSINSNCNVNSARHASGKSCRTQLRSTPALFCVQSLLVNSIGSVMFMLDTDSSVNNETMFGF